MVRHDLSLRAEGFSYKDLEETVQRVCDRFYGYSEQVECEGNCGIGEHFPPVDSLDEGEVAEHLERQMIGNPAERPYTWEATVQLVHSSEGVTRYGFDNGKFVADINVFPRAS